MKIFTKGLDHLLAIIAECVEGFRGCDEIGSSDVSAACWDVVAGLGLKRDEVTAEELGMIRNGVQNALSRVLA